MTTSDIEFAARCGPIVEQAIEDMRATGAPAHIVIDRLLTYGAFVAVRATGQAHTADQFRQIANAIEAGLFDGVGTHQAGSG